MGASTAVTAPESKSLDDVAACDPDGLAHRDFRDDKVYTRFVDDHASELLDAAAKLKAGLFFERVAHYQLYVLTFTKANERPR